ncbi:MAG: helix-turn-helix transcriptional regulator [Elusimicrobiota bacterium]
MSSKSFVKIITSRMKEKNMGVRQLARECGVDASFISKVIQGKRNPPSDEKIIKRIAQVLSVDPIMLTIFTGHIPSSLQLVLENESFVNGLVLNKQPIYGNEKNPSGKNIRTLSAPVLSPSRNIVSAGKTHQKSDITDELL